MSPEAHGSGGDVPAHQPGPELQLKPKPSSGCQAWSKTRISSTCKTVSAPRQDGPSWQMQVKGAWHALPRPPSKCPRRRLLTASVVLGRPHLDKGPRPPLPQARPGRPGLGPCAWLLFKHGLEPRHRPCADAPLPRATAACPPGPPGDGSWKHKVWRRLRPAHTSDCWAVPAMCHSALRGAPEADATGTARRRRKPLSMRKQTGVKGSVTSEGGGRGTAWAMCLGGRRTWT